MPIFGDSSTPYDEAVEKVTAETQTSENWVLMMDICDRVTSASSDAAGLKQAAKQCLLSVKKRLNHRDPHVVLFALSLLDCLWNNCGSTFRREISSKEFVGELSYKATNSNRLIAEKTRGMIKKWTESECKSDASLSLILSLYKELLADGYTFEDTSAQKPKQAISSDPNVVTSEQEEADIAKAIALSLGELKTSAQPQSNGLKKNYPSLDAQSGQQSNGTKTSQQQQKTGPNKQVLRQVRALYDFEAVEDNELSFVVGDLINVTDDGDSNWWRGCLVSAQQRGGPNVFYGLFPVSFVEPVQQEQAKNGSGNSGKVNEQKRVEPAAEPPPQIDESVMHKCVSLLQNCDPSKPASMEPVELVNYEKMCTQQGPLIDQKICKIENKLDMLAQVDVAIREVLGEYSNAIGQEQPVPPASSMAQGQGPYFT